MYTVAQYLSEIPAERKEMYLALYEAISNNLPAGFEETLTYKMPGWVVPFSLFPKGYHCDPKLPLGFISLGNQKNFVAIYHQGIYSNPKLLNWFTSEYAKRIKSKLDMGKGCIRIKKPEPGHIELVAELAQKMTPQEWIECYESALASYAESKVGK